MGTMMRKILSRISMEALRASRWLLTLFSYPEYVWMAYHARSPVPELDLCVAVSLDDTLELPVSLLVLLVCSVTTVFSFMLSGSHAYFPPIWLSSKKSRYRPWSATHKIKPMARERRMTTIVMVRASLKEGHVTL